MIAAVEALKGELHDQPLNPLRVHQVREYEDERAQLQPMVRGTDMDGRPQSFMAPARGAARARVQQIDRVLADQAPKRLTGDRASRVHARVKEVVDTVLRPALLPRSALRRNPPGAVGHLLKTEFHPVFKDAILTTKRALRALDPDNADPDYTNIERFRPEGINPDGTSTFMPDAQIPGVFGMSSLAKQNWPLGDATAETALDQVRRREAAEQAGSTDTVPGPKKPKRVLTPEQKAELVARLNKGRAAKAPAATAADAQTS